MFPQMLTDAIALILMVIVRIGIPIAITLAIGRWLEKKLAPAEPAATRATRAPMPGVTRSGKIIQIHCWDIKRCGETTRAQCAAYKRPDLPCWLALQAAGDKLREECFTCAFYKPHTMAA
jgi:hypothetical protein